MSNEQETIFKALRDDHDKQRELADKLIETSGDTKTRHSLFTKLKNELEEHAKFEERYFYKPLIDSDATQDKARHGIAEHKDLDDIIEDLEEMEMSSPGWLVRAKDLHHKINHHLDEEEHEFFQQAGKVLTEAQKTKLAQSYNKNMNA